MPIWVALFRGINVGGKNKVPMNDLRSQLEALGCTDVRSYIQSGNVVFQSPVRSRPTLTALLANDVERHQGFRPEVLLLSGPELRAAFEGNPFPQATENPKAVHAFLLARTPTRPNLEAIEKALAPTEAFRWSAKVFYLFAPEGIARSKVAAGIERWLGVTATGRNFRTMQAIVDLLP